MRNEVTAKMGSGYRVGKNSCFWYADPKNSKFNKFYDFNPCIENYAVDSSGKGFINKIHKYIYKAPMMSGNLDYYSGNATFHLNME